MMTGTAPRTPFGIVPFDERTHGLESGGTYLLVGAPGPGKMVAALQFLREGVAAGETGVLVTNADPQGVLSVASAWGVGMENAWKAGTLQIIGFRDDFELRAMRTIAPEEILEELTSAISGSPTRIAVDPGSMFLTGGAKTVLGAAFIAWMRKQRATSLATLSVDSDTGSLPSSADWLLNATTALLTLSKRPDGLYQINVGRATPGEGGGAVSLQLKPGSGFVKPDGFPTRRLRDRGDVDRGRLMLVSLGHSHASDLETWAQQAFNADIVTAPFEAVTRVQAGPSYGCVLVHAARSNVREAAQACRALRPLTRAAIVFASDDAVRATDRIQILEAGADDCLTGGLDFRELGLRIKQSMATGTKHSAEDIEKVIAAMPAAIEGGQVAGRVFARELNRRASDPNLSFFCLLDVRSGALPPTDLESQIATLVRAEDGDLVTGNARGSLVMLNGARPAQLGAFLNRFRSRIDAHANGDARLDISVLSHPADAAKIQALVGMANVAAA